MIITLTANPSHDRTVALPEPLQRGAVQRASGVISQAGGKGVNISRASVSAGACHEDRRCTRRWRLRIIQNTEYI